MSRAQRGAVCALQVVLAGLPALSRPAAAEEALAQQATPSPSAAPKTSPEPKASPEPAVRAPLPGEEQKVFVVRYIPPARLATLLQVFPARITFADRDGVSALAVSAKPAVLAAIEGTIQRLDQPSSPKSASSLPNVDLRGYVLEAMAEPAVAERLPNELDGVVAELKRTLKYPAYRLLDTIVARARSGSAFDASGVFERGAFPAPAYFNFIADRVHVDAGTTPRLIQLTRLRFGLEVPVPVSIPGAPDGRGSFQYKNIGVRSDLDIREGQHVVVGKSGVGSSDNAIVLVLSARVVD